MHGLGQDAELYPLSLLPGHRGARARPTTGGMSRMEKPALLGHLHRLDLAATIWPTPWPPSRTASTSSGPSPPRPTSASSRSRAIRAFLDARSRREPRLDARLNPSKPRGLGHDPRRRRRPRGHLAPGRAPPATCKRDNPFSLYQIVLRSDSRFPSEKLAARAARRLLQGRPLLRALSRYFSLDPQPSYQARLFFATRNPSLAYRAMEEATRTWRPCS